jgi:hypothetical protein
MQAKNNRVNTDFQIVHFLIGSCHTVDGAYALLCDLLEERQMTINSLDSMRLKQKSRRLAAERRASSSDEVVRTRGLADLSEGECNLDLFEKNVKAAFAELSFLNNCVERLQPYRKYAHLPDPEAHAACQREEWRLELINRAENALITSGTIPIDEFKTMRMHPDFETGILPEITHIKNCVEQGRVHDRLFPEKSQPLRNLLSSDGALAGLLPASETPVNGSIATI